MSVHAAPDKEVIATLAQNAENIKVVGLSNDGTWGIVNIEDQHGWIAMQRVERSQKAGYPLQLESCIAAPSWSLRVGRDTVFDDGSGDAPKRQSYGQLHAFNNFDRFAALARGPDGWMVATISPGLCPDTGSDRQFGLSASVVFASDHYDPYMLSGCCSMIAK